MNSSDLQIVSTQNLDQPWNDPIDLANRFRDVLVLEFKSLP
jgi:hypothetical protein